MSPNEAPERRRQRRGTAEAWWADPTVAAVLDRSELVHLAVRSSRGPHVTPVAFHRQGRRLWLVAARDSVKVRAVAGDPVVGALIGLVRPGAPAVMCAGRARIVDPLTLRGIGPGVLDLPLAVGSYLLRNLRPAVAVIRERPVPTLPIARVLIVVELTGVALLRDLRVVSAWGGWQRSDLLLQGTPPPVGAPRLGGVPAHLRTLIPSPSVPSRPGVLGWETLSGPMAIPAHWESGGSTMVTCAEAMTLAGGASSSACCFTVAAGTRRSDPRDGLLLRGAGRALRQHHIAHVALDVRRVTWWTGVRAGSFAVGTGGPAAGLTSS